MRRMISKKYSQKCDLCDSLLFEVVIDIKGKVLTSDRKIVFDRLKKIQCLKCGLITSALNQNNFELMTNYKNDYSYNLSEKGDTFFFSEKGFQGRSSHVFKWILSILSKEDLSKIQTIIEVGCGQGNLLSEFSNQFPEKKIIGLEVNEDAIRIGRQKGLDIRRLEESTQIKGDLVISYAVIEHIPSPKEFLRKLTGLLNPKGLIIIGQPHQDRKYYDIFFLDHLHHFSTKHIEDFGRLMNLVQKKKSVGRWPIDSFSLHLFRQSDRKLSHKITFRKTQVKNSILFYNSVFDKIDKFLNSINKSNNLSVFGLGEVFSLFYAYTNLKKMKIKYGIDDFPKDKDGFTFPVISTNEVDGHDDVGHLLFCINPRYYKIMLKKFGKIGQRMFFPFNN